MGTQEQSTTNDPVLESDSKVNPDLACAATELGIKTGQVAELKGADAVLVYASATAIDIDPETDKRLLRKIDLHVLPWLCVLYILQYLDKGVLTYSGVMGIKTEAQMSSSQYSWLGSIYYLGYIVSVPIHNRLFQHFTPSKYIAINVALWGMVLACMAACKDWKGLMVQRTFIGALEGCINPGFMLVTAAWYKKYEHASRTGLWSACTGIATIIGGLIAYGCVSGQDKNPNTALSSWKILALCTGLLSVVYGCCMWYFMAGSVVTAKFFNEEERILAVERLRNNHQGVGSHTFKRYQAKEAFTDYRTWMYVVFVLSSQIPAAGLVLLQSVLIKSLGFDSKTTLLLAMPTGAVGIISNVGFGYLADRTKQRSLVAMVCALLTLFAVSLLVGLGNVAPHYKKYGQLIAYFLMIGTSATPWFIVISMMSSNMLGTTKKTTSSSIVFCALAVAYFVGPQIFQDGPYYPKAKYASIGLWVLSIIILLAFYTLNRLENRSREKAVGMREQEHAAGIEFMDLTDRENKLFRYVL
ncbi:MAG: hypothetical protein M1834_006553 [Cirrosporium novae-zelandiae]|nr:MAG: hypothetical protein M1834_006553 [Cirrosporium novae-zelandiae]